MRKLIAFAIILIISLLLPIPKAFSQVVSEPFEFKFENKTLKGLIEKPNNQKSKAIVIIIPGYGKTDFVEGNWYANLREKLVSYGLTVCFWDKMGCGNSDGEFDAQQPVENSAKEAIAAIQEIKRLKISGSEKIGLWGISRAGWIVPLINEQFPIDFWVSVSGTDDKENFGYLLKSNLIIEGKEEEEANKLYKAWKLGHKIFSTRGKYKDYVNATQPLRQDSMCQKLFGYTPKSKDNEEEDRKGYLQQQLQYTSKGHFDAKSGLWVYIDNFDKTLLKVNCPVLALFGANDSQVDWRKTKKLYEETIGVNPDSKLTVKVFENCNHTLKKCITCGWREDLSALKWQACDNYYETMKEWLKKNKIIE
ncbi:CocE/NonD family hydrolase [Aquimarina gracilis]|uniref:CocE/NonD family hydrolase n=1 Tax=Aquimarina gracilis TaxID=874422 RepID=A0ABU5ZUU6_9FLAO|nr:CocE/NonD family hydrolase [Aquimarina gracilis]MEB3345157.1 CocE/NonD family hydrolase [Aquimarina gracilis]